MILHDKRKKFLFFFKVIKDLTGVFCTIGSTLANFKVVTYVFRWNLRKWGHWPYFQITDQNSEKLCRLFEELAFYLEKYIK
jgi:hypothetical protein